MMMRIFTGLLFMMAVLLAVPALAAPDAGKCAAQGGEIIGTVCVPTQAETGLAATTIPTILVNVANWIVYIYGSIAVAVIMICGFQYLLATGDDSQAESAKRCVKWAVVGMAIVSLSYVFIFTMARLITGEGPGGILGSIFG